MSIELEVGASSVILPAGRYVIGDPWYHVPDDQWDHVLSESDFFEGQCWSRFKTTSGDEGTVVAFSTAYSDGVYTDVTGREFPVDAGLIGIIPFSDVDVRELDLSCAHVIEFTAPFTCKCSGGVIVFGYIEINTDDDNTDDLSDEPDTW